MPRSLDADISVENTSFQEVHQASSRALPVGWNSRSAAGDGALFGSETGAAAPQRRAAATSITAP